MIAAPVALATALFFAPAVHGEAFKWRGQTITYTGAELKWSDPANPGADNSEPILVFKTDGSFTTLVPIEARALIVGGGGAGGYGTTGTTNPGGGGGGGEVKELPNTGYGAGTFSAVVGAGGKQTTTTVNGEDGHPSSFTAEGKTTTALGGGGGGAKKAGNGDETVATGGGGGGKGNLGGVGTLGEDHKGGNATENNRSGGGGGAGGFGQDSAEKNGGDGGAGIESDIWLNDDKSNRAFGGGGGGGHSQATTASTSVGLGKDGGGNGGRQNLAPEPGQPNTGGGGGGGGRSGATHASAAFNGAAGGSGVVIIRITYIEQPMVWKSVEVVDASGHTGKIYIDENATATKIGNEVVITYLNTDRRGGLRFYDPDVANQDPIWAQARILAVGGGGGGGFVNVQKNGGGGGGGAGGFLEESGILFSTNHEYTIAVGAGGKGGSTNDEAGDNGDDSFVRQKDDDALVMSDVAHGGGGGGAESNGKAGGSGGGGSRMPGQEPTLGGEGTSGQGFAGGSSGGGNLRGAGGGGAGEKGGDSTASSPGAGGKGKSSNITGNSLTYAGGGGGARLNPDSGSTNPGGAGGEGGGGAGAGNGAAKNGDPNTGGGGGGGAAYANATAPAGNGGSGIVIIRLSNFVIGTVKVPVAPDPFIYDGNAHTGLVEFFAYTLSGTPVATNADVYTAYATITNGSPWTWSDGKRDTKKVVWSIVPRPVDVPTVNATPSRPDYFVFGNAARNDEEEKLAVNATLWRLATRTAYPGVETCATTNSLGMELPYCSLEGHRETNAGEYHFTATLLRVDPYGNFATNFVWRTPAGSTQPQDKDWSIEQAENKITSLSIESWQEGTDAKAPSSAWLWQGVRGKHPASYPTEDVVKYRWKVQGGDWDVAEPKVWSEVVKPTEPNVYWLEASVVKDSNHEPGNWGKATDTVRFCIWRHPSKTLSDFVDIKVNSTTAPESGSALADFPVLVRLREPERDAAGSIVDGLPGFRYADVDRNGLELRFIANAGETRITESDETRDLTKDVLLPFEIDTWNPGGESLVWVKVPKMFRGGYFRMYWRVRNGVEVIDDLLPSDTWANGYVGVWHMGKKDGEKLRNSTAIGAELDAVGTVELVESKVGKAALVTAGNVTAPNYEPYMATPGKFTVSAWYRGDTFTQKNYMFAGKKLDGQTSSPWDYSSGWCWIMPNNLTKPRAYASNGNLGDPSDLTDITKNWHMLTYISPGTASGTKTAYYDGTTQSRTSTKTTVTNALPFQLVGKDFAADELRLSSIDRSATWVKAEYESVNDEKYCTFGLVSKLQGTEGDEDVRAWVNFWQKGYAPWEQASSKLSPSGKDKGVLWLEGELTPSVLSNKFYLGKLVSGSPSAAYFRMPQHETVVFPVEPDPYEIRVTILAPELGTPEYPGPHVLFDDERVIDIEILEKVDPSPIDPGGKGGPDAVNARVLLGNDDVPGVAANAVTNQSLWCWESTGQPAPESCPNLLPGTEHKLKDSGGTNLWVAQNVYLGNIMTDDDAAEKPFAETETGWHTLPWSATSRNSRTKALYDEPLRRSEVGTFALRNLGGHSDDNIGAQIVSGVYPDGVGTVYFDAVNAYDTSSTNYQLIVEWTEQVDEQIDLAGWERLDNLIQMTFEGGSAKSTTTNDVVTLAARGGNGKDRFTRVIAKVDKRVPIRFRIRRYLSESSLGNDDPKGFIVLDNIIASWPTADVKLKTYGWYDEKKKGRQVLGMETAFSVPFPQVGETNLWASAWLEDGPVAASVISARLHYRWRHLETMFDPPRQMVNGFTQDVFTVLYLDPEKGYRTIEPLDLPALPGDVEYYYDLTANVPFYGYVDYSGCGAEKPVGDYTEEPAKRVTSRRPEEIFQPSCGREWFVRLREHASACESVCIHVRGAEDFMRQDVEMELVGDHIWRGFVATTARPASGLIEYSVDIRRPAEPGSTVERLDVSHWKGKDDLLREKDIPGTVGLVPAADDEWSKLSCNASTGCLMFRLNDETKSLEVARADNQTFDAWSSSWRGAADLKYFTSANETNSVSDAKTRYPALGELSPTYGFPETLAVRPQWREDFSVSGGQSSSGYPLNKPFSTALTPNGSWTASQGMWVSQVYGMTNLQSFALQLEGRGKGTLEFVNASDKPAPNGLDTLSFTSRLAQFIDFNGISYYTDGSRLTNYTVMAQAAFDQDQAFGGFTGAGSVSLIAGYQPKKGCYEFRITMVNADPELNDRKGQCRFEFWRWNVVDGRMTATNLYSTVGDDAPIPSGWTWSGTTKRSMAAMMPLGVEMPYTSDSPLYSGLFLSYRVTPSGVQLVGGVTSDDSSRSKQPLDPDFEYSGCTFNSISVTDRSDDRFTRGTYGVMANDCPAVFFNPRTYTNSFTTASYSGSAVTGSAVTRSFNFTNDLGVATSELEHIRDDWWALEPGRIVSSGPDAAAGISCGLRSDPSVRQTLRVLSRKSGTSGVWTELTNVVNTSFAATEFTKSLQTPDKCDIRFAVGGEAEDARVDVVLDSVAMSQWCGEDGSKTNAASAYGYWQDFYYMGSWVKDLVKSQRQWDKEASKYVTVTTTNRYLHLIPSRAPGAAHPVGIRTPYMKGLGSISFSYRNAKPGAKLQLQKRRCGYSGGDGHLTDAPDDWTDWELVEEYSFDGAPSGEDVTYHLGDRYKDGTGGYFRLVVPRETVEYALSPEGRAAGEDWGSVELWDVCCYDEPAYDVRSWWGWNFLTTGWTNNVPSGYVNLYDGPAGSVAALNNTLDPKTLVDGDPKLYERCDPFVQTPTFTNGVVGEVSFQARVFDPDYQLGGTPLRPSCLTVWGTRDGALQNPKDWIAVTNILIDSWSFRRYTIKLGDSMRFASVRLGVSGVDGIEEPLTPAAGAAIPNPAQRVLIDDFVVCERGKPEMRFRLNYVRPFRLGLADRTAVPNIASRDQQPLLNEEFGFQAELDMSSTSGEIDYSRTPQVTVSYYPSDEPWGYSNWCTNDAAVKDIPLTAAEGTNYVYRSTSEQSLSFCPPQQRLPGNVYGLVQYSMSVTYWDLSGEAHTAPITEDDWMMPSWYYGFEDPNESHGAFSPFTVLDVVSPGRAWINEVNFSNGADKLEDRQFVEICVPAGYDMEGWQLWGYDVYADQRYFGSLGEGEIPASKDTAHAVEGFDFLTLKSPKSTVAEADASWQKAAGELGENESYGFRLVRPSGVIEQQIVVQGKLGTSTWSRNKLGTNMVVQLNKLVGGDWTFVAADTNAVTKSVGVVRNVGERMDDWYDNMNQTPSALNEGQVIPQGWFLPPTGTNVWISLTATDSHISILNGTNEVDALTVIVPIGTSTNILFRAAPWYQLGKLVRNATQDVTAAAVRTGRTWCYTALEQKENRQTLTVSSAIDQSVIDVGGLDPNSPYAPAVMNWLSHGVTRDANGEEQPFEGDEIVCAACRDIAGNFITNLTVVDMYWFDIDPTSGNWDLWQGMGELAGNHSPTPPAGQKVHEASERWPETVTNRLYTVTMMITNTAERTEDYPVGGTAHPPYRLQGLGNERSDDPSTYPNGWTSVTAKVKMSLLRTPGPDEPDVRERFLTMQAFTFDQDSFGACEGHPFASYIEILDPYSPSSPGFSYGWHAYPGLTFGVKGTIDNASVPQAPKVLKSDNTWDQEWSDGH